MQIDEPHRFLLLIAISKGRVGAKEVHERDEPHRLLLLIAISKGRVGAKEVHERDEPHRGSAFDSPGLPNDSAGYPGLGYGLWRTTP